MQKRIDLPREKDRAGWGNPHPSARSPAHAPAQTRVRSPFPLHRPPVSHGISQIITNIPGYLVRGKGGKGTTSGALGQDKGTSRSCRPRWGNSGADSVHVSLKTFLETEWAASLSVDLLFGGAQALQRRRPERQRAGQRCLFPGGSCLNPPIRQNGLDPENPLHCPKAQQAWFLYMTL